MGKYTAIDDPSAYFQTALYTGAGSTVVTVTNDGNSDLQPDFLWFKRRDAAVPHVLLDTNRGANVTSGFGPTGYSSALNSSSTASEVADSTGVMTITSDGFTVKELTYAGGNTNTGSMVAWQWHCNGGTNSSNTDGSITSTVQANQDAGFSIVTWTGNENASATVGHGLGVAPDMWIAKRRNGTYNWQVYTSALAPVGGNNLFMVLNGDAAAEQVSGTSFTSSSTFQPGSNAKRNSGDMIAYCFAEKQGYSKFGKYVGNGNDNGPFVCTGFKPAFIMTKKDGTSGWFMQDIKRGIKNQDTNTPVLQANGTYSEATVGFTNYEIDFLSNGFKLRDSNTYVNASGSSYIYMAFAESPFVTSTGIPTTAR